MLEAELVSLSYSLRVMTARNMGIKMSSIGKTLLFKVNIDTVRVNRIIRCRDGRYRALAKLFYWEDISYYLYSDSRCVRNTL